MTTNRALRTLVTLWVATVGFGLHFPQRTLVCAAASQPNVPNQTDAPIIDFEANLPLIFLEAKDQIDSDRKVTCKMRVTPPKSPTFLAIHPLSGVVRYHGGSSLGFEKKSFSVTLNEPMSLVGMTGRSQWILNAAFIDRSLMRHKLSYDLFRSLSDVGSKRFAAESRFVELYFNGRYHGVYLLMGRVDRQLLELRRHASNEVSHACIYKAIDHAARFDQTGHAGYEQREPDPTIGPYWQPLDELNQFANSASDARFFDPQTGIESRFDLGNAIDFHLLVLFTSNIDGVTKNFILGRDAMAKGFVPPLFFFAPWDYDATFGRNYNATRVVPSVWLSHHFFDRLFRDRTYRQRFVARWKHVREKEFSVKTVGRMMDENALTLGEAVRRNSNRWRSSADAYPDRLTFEEDLKEMKEWIVARTQWLDQEIEKLGQRP